VGLRWDLSAPVLAPINRLFTLKLEKSGRGQKQRPPLLAVERVQNRAIHVSSEVVLRPMKSGGSWNLRGLRPQTVEAAREAARRSGRSLGEWLNDLIEEHNDYRRAAMQPGDYGDIGEDGGWPAREELGEIQDRLDRLTGQIERLARGSAPLRGAPMQAPHGVRDNGSRSYWADPRPRSRNFAARQQGAFAEDNDVLAGEGDLSSPAIAPRAAGETSGLERAGEFPELEEQLRRITAKIEALRPSSETDKIIAGFRDDLAQIRHQITEALPRQAVESLCAEVESLTRRIDHSRVSTADVEAIAGIERGLAEVRDALHRMATAEKLVGFDDALKTLAQKLDLIIAREDPAALEQLETAIGALRGVVSHVASNDALNKVADDVHTLAAKIDALAKGGGVGGQGISALGSRIDTLADALNASAAAGQAVPREMEKLLSGVIEKLEAVRLAAADPSAFKRLEERIAHLIGRLDASDAQLGNLAAIERGLADLLARMGQPRGDETGGVSSVPRAAAVAAIAQDIAQGLAQDLAEIKVSERRTQDSLEAVHGTVEQVVGRLAMIESDIHDATLRAPRSQAVAPAAAGKPVSSANPVAASAAAADLELSDRQDFIAAARRATQAAAILPDDDASRSRSRRRRHSRGSDLAHAEAKRPSRLRKLLVAAGIVVVTVGCLQIALHIFQDSSLQDTQNTRLQDSRLQDTRPDTTRPDAEGAWRQPSPPASIPQNNSDTAPPQAAPVRPAPETFTPPPAAPQMPAPIAPAADAGSDADSATVPQPAPPKPMAPHSMAPNSMAPNTAEPTGSLARPAPVFSAPLPPAANVATTAAPADNHAAEAAAVLPSAIGGFALRTAAMAGDAAAQFEIAVRFAEGRSVPADERQAAHWLELAAKQGLAPAQFRLGGYYEKGIGVKKDLAVARELYLAAAAKGNGKAMHNIAVLYAEGANGRADYRSAALWFRKAADRGIADSQYNLAVLCARGTGTPQNYTEAYKWFALAAKQGDVEAARKRDEMASQLDDDTLAAIDLAVKNWRPEPQPDDAVRVKTPPGGWDTSAPSKPKPRTKNASLAPFDQNTN
jgi:localization factor PodJL